MQGLCHTVLGAIFLGSVPSLGQTFGLSCALLGVLVMSVDLKALFASLTEEAHPTIHDHFIQLEKEQEHF